MISLKDHPLVKLVLKLNLPVDDWAVIGTGCMLAHDLLDIDKDIDLIARGEAWEQAKNDGETMIPESGIGELISCFGGKVEIFNQWAPGEWNVDYLIGSAEVIGGIRFVTLGNVLRWKRIKYGLTKKGKDLKHIMIIENFLSKR